MKLQRNSEFKNFILALIKKRVFQLSAFLGFAALLIQLKLSEFSLPQFYAFGFVFIGLAWAAFQVYRDLSLKHQTVLSSIASDKAPRSRLSISFANGNEYAYSISDPYAGKNRHITKIQRDRKKKSRFNEKGVFFIDGKPYYPMGKGNLAINLQILNSGDLPLDLLAMDLDNDLNLTHLSFAHEGIFRHGRRLQLPFHLDPGGLVTVQARYGIIIGRGSHAALFAADFRFLPRSILHAVSIGILDTGGREQTCTAQIKTLSKPLVDLYLRQWQEYQQDEYLVMAGHKLTQADGE